MVLNWATALANPSASSGLVMPSASLKLSLNDGRLKVVTDLAPMREKVASAAPSTVAPHYPPGEVAYKSIGLSDQTSSSMREVQS